jgi:hypothetical protein
MIIASKGTVPRLIMANHPIGNPFADTRNARSADEAAVAAAAAAAGACW